MSPNRIFYAYVNEHKDEVEQLWVIFNYFDFKESKHRIRKGTTLYRIAGFDLQPIIKETVIAKKKRIDEIRKLKKLGDLYVRHWAREYVKISKIKNIYGYNRVYLMEKIK